MGTVALTLGVLLGAGCGGDGEGGLVVDTRAPSTTEEDSPDTTEEDSPDTTDEDTSDTTDEDTSDTTDEPTTTRPRPTTTTTDPEPTTTFTPTPSTTATSTGLSVGDEVIDYNAVTASQCLDETAAFAGDSLGTVTVADCGVAHDAEVFFVFDLTDYPGDTYPGDETLEVAADPVCQANFDAYVGRPYLESRLDYGFIYPTQTTWLKLGDRRVICYLIDARGEKLTGPKAGSGE